MIEPTNFEDAEIEEELTEEQKHIAKKLKEGKINFNRPDGVSDAIWEMFMSIVNRSINDITICKSLMGRPGIEFTDSLNFFNKGGGLDWWLHELGVRGDDKAWEVIRLKCLQKALDKQKELAHTLKKEEGEKIA